MDEYWARLYSGYLKWKSAELSQTRSAAIESSKHAMVEAFGFANELQKDALKALLGVGPAEGTPSPKSLFASAVLWNVSFAGHGLPEKFFIHLVDAAIAEDNPSVNRYYVEPCLMAFGRRRTVAELERRLALSQDRDLTDRINSALYWTGFPVNGSRGL